MISQLINAMLHNTKNPPPAIDKKVTAAEVDYVMKQLKATGISLR